MINWKAIGIAVALWFIFLKVNNVMPTELSIPLICMIIGLSIAFVFLSRIIIRVEKGELLVSAAIVAGIIYLAATNLTPAMLGITNVPKYYQLPGMQGILDWFVVDLLGIPAWAIWIAFIAIIIFILMNPLLGIGMALILLGVALFFITPGIIFDDIIVAGLGVITAVAGITRKKGGGPGGRFVSQPIINIYDNDGPGPVIGGNAPVRRQRDWSWFYGR